MSGASVSEGVRVGLMEPVGGDEKARVIETANAILAACDGRDWEDALYACVLATSTLAHHCGLAREAVARMVLGCPLPVESAPAPEPAPATAPGPAPVPAAAPARRPTTPRPARAPYTRRP